MRDRGQCVFVDVFYAQCGLVSFSPKELYSNYTEQEVLYVLELDLFDTQGYLNIIFSDPLFTHPLTTQLGKD